LTMEQRIDFNSNKEQLFTDVFYRLYQANTRYVLNYGSAGSGKSHGEQQNSSIEMLQGRKGNILYMRKVGATLIDSCIELTSKLISAYGLEDHFTKANTKHGMEIRLNGSDWKYYYRGADKIDKLKSVVNVRKVVLEEADQFTESDFLEIDRRMRDFPDCQIIMNLNPISEYHWTKKLFIDGNEYKDDLTVIHSTYLDNEKNLPPAYIKSLLRLKQVCPEDYEVYALGRWGVMSKENKFAWAYNPVKHGATVEIDKEDILYLSFDFNVDPITCLVAQINTDDKLLTGIEMIKIPNSNIYELCERIISTYPDMIYMVTGDASGSSRTAMVREELNYYKIIKQQLNLTRGQIEVRASNPTITNNRVLVNGLLQVYDCVFDNEKCAGLHDDLRYAEVKTKTGEDGKTKVVLKKDNRTDERQQLDALDCLRYLMNTFLKDEFKRMLKQ